MLVVAHAEAAPDAEAVAHAEAAPDAEDVAHAEAAPGAEDVAHTDVVPDAGKSEAVHSPAPDFRMSMRSPVLMMSPMLPPIWS